jgi:hypothetical protein
MDHASGFSGLVPMNREKLAQIDAETLENTLLALVPMLEIALKQTSTMRDNITAYSTAVGPSSEARKQRSDVQ